MNQYRYNVDFMRDPSNTLLVNDEGETELVFALEYHKVQRHQGKQYSVLMETAQGDGIVYYEVPYEGDAMVLSLPFRKIFYKGSKYNIHFTHDIGEVQL